MEQTTQKAWVNAVKHKAALDLLRMKATSQMVEGKTTCTLNEVDIQEILLVAGMPLNTVKELEVIL